MFVDLQCKDCNNTWTTAADSDGGRVTKHDLDDPSCPICGSDSFTILHTHKPESEPRFDTGCTYDDGPSGKNRNW